MIESATIDGLEIHGGANGVGLTSFDLGSPSPRVVTEALPFRHGSSDATAYYGGRVVLIEGLVRADTLPAMWGLLDDVKQAMSLGALRPLVFRREGQSESERLLVRPDGPVLAPVTTGMRGPMIRWSAQLFAPDPRMYSDTVSTGAYDPTDTGDGGLLFDLDFELAFGASGAAALTVTNEGTIGTPAVFTITGPVVNPIIDNDTTGQSIHTTGLDLAAGSTVVLDTGARTLRLGGTTLRPDLIDSQLTTWFELAPGTNQLRMRGSGMSATETELAVAYRSARI